MPDSGLIAEGSWHVATCRKHTFRRDVEASHIRPKRFETRRSNTDRRQAKIGGSLGTAKGAPARGAPSFWQSVLQVVRDGPDQTIGHRSNGQSIVRSVRSLRDSPDPATSETERAARPGTKTPSRRCRPAAAGSAPPGAPAQRLDRDAQVLLEADRVHDVPAVHAEPLLAPVEPVGLDHLGIAQDTGVENTPYSPRGCSKFQAPPK